MRTEAAVAPSFEYVFARNPVTPALLGQEDKIDQPLRLSSIALEIRRNEWFKGDNSISYRSDVAVSQSLISPEKSL